MAWPLDQPSPRAGRRGRWLLALLCSALLHAVALAMLRERLAAPVASDAGCCEIRLEVTRAPSPAPATEKGREYTSWSVSGEAMTGIPGANEPPPTMPTTVEAPPASAAVTRTQDDGAAPPSTSSSTQLDEPEPPKPESAGDEALAARPVKTRQSVSVAAEPGMAGDPPSRSTTASEAATTRVAEIRRAASVATALLAERRQQVSRARPPAPTRATPRPAAPPESIRKRAAKASLPARSTPAVVANPSASADTVTASLSSSANADRSDKARAPDPGGEQSVAPKPPPAPPPSRAHGERYLSEIARLLDRSKRYPLQARRRHHEGVVAMRFVIDRDGKLLEHSIQRSSGSGLLDDAARELIASVAPYPPPPRGIGSMPIELVVPIQYRLSR